ncbi:hypothetical protein EB73_22870 [Mycobacterium sp. SWH-M3]|nr:hypothetical protein EB73_22870 [Mycobacterium sp. SWH-M3]
MAENDGATEGVGDDFEPAGLVVPETQRVAVAVDDAFDASGRRPAVERPEFPRSAAGEPQPELVGPADPPLGENSTRGVDPTFVWPVQVGAAGAGSQPDTAPGGLGA